MSPMESVYIALVLLGAFVPAAIIVLKTNQSAKRGCGRGCATCGNREFCHRGEETLKKSKRQQSGSAPLSAPEKRGSKK